MNEVNVKNWKRVRDVGSALPAKEFSGEWFRGNELGYLVFNPFFWEGIGIEPPHLALGITPKQHAAIRPFMEELWSIEAADTQDVTRLIQAFLSHRWEAGRLRVQKDLQIMVHQLLYQLTLGEHVTYEEADTFVGLQNSLLTLGVVTEALPRSWYGVLPVLYELQAQVTNYVRKFAVILEKRFGPELGKLDCSPSPNCTVQLASAVFDGFFAAGGASVPQAIGTGLGVLYSRNNSNPALATTNDTSTLVRGSESRFFWEVIRFFPPVVGFPHWERAPACSDLHPDGRRLANDTVNESANESGNRSENQSATESVTKSPTPSPTPMTQSPTNSSTESATQASMEPQSGNATVNATASATENGTEEAASECVEDVWVGLNRSRDSHQWGSGARVVLNLGKAMQDKQAWGKSAKRFMLRKLKTYEARSVGFGEMAQDDSVAGGAMNRVCPGKRLALLMGKTFFEVFNQSEWYPSTTDIFLQPFHASMTVADFTLKPLVASARDRRLGDVVI